MKIFGWGDAEPCQSVKSVCIRVLSECPSKNTLANLWGWPGSAKFKVPADLLIEFWRALEIE
jgi:hypothetical protein